MEKLMELAVCYKSVCSCSTYEIDTQKYVCVSSIYYCWVGPKLISMKKNYKKNLLP